MLRGKLKPGERILRTKKNVLLNFPNNFSWEQVENSSLEKREKVWKTILAERGKSKWQPKQCKDVKVKTLNAKRGKNSDGRICPNQQKVASVTPVPIKPLRKDFDDHSMEYGKQGFNSQVIAIADCYNDDVDGNADDEASQVKEMC